MRKGNFWYVVSMLLWVTANVSAQSLTIGTSTAASPGQTITVSMTAPQGLSDVGAISLRIGYSTTYLTYVGIENGPSGALANATGGNVNIGWFSTTPLNVAGGGKVLDLKFTYNGGLSNGQTTPLTFVMSGCQISNSSGVTIPVTYNNGSVTGGGGGGSASLALGAATATSAGQSITISMTAPQGLSDVGAISLQIGYNTAYLTYVGIENGPSGALANATGGKVNIGWFSTTPLNVASGGKVLDLKFTYTSGLSSGQTTPVTFVTSGCQISNSSGVTIVISYTNGSVTRGDPSGISGEENQPVYFGLSQNYPNPFNPTTRIEFTLPDDGIYEIDLYDVNARKIRQIANEFRSAGLHTLNLDGRRLPSGSYYVELRFKGLRDTKKITLLK